MLHALGESFPIANRRFLSTERKLGSNDNLRADYFEFMTEYENLGHMEPVKPDLTKPHYYLPHHAIQRPESTTTKTRVVFDASCRAANNISLNDICYIGPTVQPSLISTLINFRLPKYAVTADVEKMYRQIVVHPADRPLQQILWRKNPEAPLQTFRLNTVTYGTAPAPYLATRVLNQLAHDEAENFPLAAPLVPKRFYVDDYLSGNDDKQLLIAENHQMIELLKSGGFTLRKWCSNCNEVLSQIPEALRDSRSELDIGQSGSIKTLGLRWHPQPDHFTFNVPDLETSAPITKRVILSEMSRLFDPMGLLGASVVSAKIFLQSLWSEKFSWNDPLPVHHQTWWQQYRQEMESFRSLAIPRQVFMNDYENFELHCFSDASDSAYGCCIYVLSSNAENKPICNLLASKSRVSPLNKLSTPRLELCAALLAAQLQDSIVEYTGWNCPVTFWTDSTIVLHWLASSSSVWKVFVSNRIAEIHRITRGSPWRHIPTDLNPADRISRGVSPSALIADNLWWHGPNFLCTDKSNWPPNDISLSPLHMQARGIESKQSTVSLVAVTESPFFHPITDHSRLSPLQRKVAWGYRFIQNCRTKPDKRNFGSLNAHELNASLNILIRHDQKTHYNKEIQFLKNASEPIIKNIGTTSKLKSLNVFLDESGLLRLQGRLQHLDAPFDTRFPIILAHKSHLAYLLAKSIHLNTLHAGPQMLLATIRQRFWPIRGRDLVKKVVKECLVCFRCKPTSASQIMGPLPSVRLTPTRAFVSCGVDYCGPFFVRIPNRRSAPLKIFVAIFVCMWSKAVHIDMVYSLTSESFINALKRIVGRRGRVADIYCDNALTFVGANRLLQESKQDFDKMHSSDEIGTHCADNGIVFHFNPARSPHFGGLWEAAVKSFKHHLYRVMQTTVLNIDDFNTLLIQVEAVMNSRPLTPRSSEPDDVVALTPGHFIVGEPLVSLPEVDISELPINRLNSFQQMQQRVQHFWQAWSRDYIGQLQNRKKWPVVRPNISEGTLVLMKQDNAPPLSWKLGRIEKVFPGDDGRVRVVTVKTAKNSYRRGVTEICPLPIEEPTTLAPKEGISEPTTQMVATDESVSKKPTGSSD